MKTSILAVALAAALAGCITHESANVYSKHEAGREQTVRMATVDSVRKVTLEGSQSGLGGAAGGAVGGIAGSQVGQGAGSSVAAVLGAVAGGVAGNALESKTTSHDALEITVRLDSGEMRAIVQEADQPFTPGQRVRLLSSGGVTRVTPN
ncbi:MAG TPA: glycine zipper 2TM domain-containing protein [Burkholderiales bacterium]|jgi:outer membrane lipoprotein SlyB|nr:glycine zipper 2TM domain-containing protein [Burkholderiales bacterium]